MSIGMRDSWLEPFKLLTIKDVLNLPAAEWAIEGVLEDGAFGVLYGPSGEGKSFVALDMALSIATGRDWQGRRVKPGSVIYIVGEGGRGIAKRIKAWLQHHGVTSVDTARFSLRPVQVLDPSHREHLLSQIRTAVNESKAKPTLIVLDTLARCFVRGDEDRAQDMGEFIEAIQKVQLATGAAVLTVHHTLKDAKKKNVERGSTALRGAADLMMLVRRASKGCDLIQLTTTKQKDHEPADDIVLRLQPVQVGVDSSQQPVTSCVVLNVNADEARASAKFARLSKADSTVLSVLSAHNEGITTTAWQRESQAVPSSFYRSRKRLRRLAYAEQKGRLNLVTDLGRRALEMSTPTSNSSNDPFSQAA